MLQVWFIICFSVQETDGLKRVATNQRSPTCAGHEGEEHLVFFLLTWTKRKTE